MLIITCGASSQRLAIIDRCARCLSPIITQGPTYVNLSWIDSDKAHVRRVGNFYFDQGFAELLAQQALLATGSISGTKLRVAHALTTTGCETMALLPYNIKEWAALLEDVYCSPAAIEYKQRLLQTCHDHDEYESLSIDCTFRIMMSLQGQVSYRMPRSIRDLQPLAAGAQHAILSVRGKTGDQSRTQCCKTCP